MKKRICVLTTGGTIGSKMESCIEICNTQNTLLIDLAKGKVGDMAFDLFPVLDIHSENVQVNDLYKIVESIKNVNTDLYDGIILTHGTDTLSFTANYLSLVLDLPIPVVLVSANYPLDDERSNGLDNFISAVRFVEKTDYRGVFVSYKNVGEENKIHLASRLLEARQFDGYVDSFGGKYFGRVECGEFVENSIPKECIARKSRETTFSHELSTDVVVIGARALTDYGVYDFSKEKVKAVIVTTYHSGTVCTVGENTSFLNFAKRCLEQGIEVVLAPIDKNANLYESAVGLEDCATLSYNQSVGITVVKVMLAISQGKEIRYCLDCDFACEKV